MKSILVFVFWGVLFSSPIYLFAQEEQTGNPLENIELIQSGILLNENTSLYNIQSSNQFIQNENSIHISQIGDYNFSKVEMNVENSTLNVNQNGYNNYLVTYKSAIELNQSIIQSGNTNFISDFFFFFGTIINMDIHQEGNNLTLFNTGSNSISKDLKITQTGNSGVIYIFSH